MVLADLCSLEIRVSECEDTERAWRLRQRYLWSALPFAVDSPVQILQKGEVGGEKLLDDVRRHRDVIEGAELRDDPSQDRDRQIRRVVADPDVDQRVQLILRPGGSLGIVDPSITPDARTPTGISPRRGSPSDPAPPSSTVVASPLAVAARSAFCTQLSAITLST